MSMREVKTLSNSCSVAEIARRGRDLILRRRIAKKIQPLFVVTRDGI